MARFSSKVVLIEPCAYSCSDAASESAAAQNHVHSLMRSWLRFQRSQETMMARKRAQERLDKVLETYTDVTRFPR